MLGEDLLNAPNPPVGEFDFDASRMVVAGEEL